MNAHSEAQILLNFQGGLLGKLMTWLGLNGCTYQQIGRRILFWVCLSWLPPLLLVGVGTFVTPERYRMDFLSDLSFHVRNLISIPLLVAFECRIQREFRGVLGAVTSRRMFRHQTSATLKKISEQIQSLQASIAVDLLLVLLSFAMVSGRLHLDLPAHVSSWRTSDSLCFVLAQLWGRWISMTAYYFIVFGWVWRFLVWSYFLLQLALRNPSLKSLHPDRVGGLAFLLRYHKMFGLVALSVSSVVSANIAVSVLYGDIPIGEFFDALLFYLCIYNLVLAIPLFVFTPVLVKSRNHGLIRYARFGSSYADEFDQRWLSHANENTKRILGVPDIQSLNDLHGSYRSQAQMRISLMDMRTLVVNTVFIVAPLLPLVLFKLPVQDLMLMIAKYFFKM